MAFLKLPRYIALTILAVVSFIWFIPTSAYSLSLITESRNEESLWDCEVLVSKEKAESAIPTLERLYKIGSSKIRRQAAVKLARVYRQKKQYDKALSYLEEFIQIDRYEEYPLLEDYPILEAGLTYNRKKEYTKALKLFDYMGKNNALGMKTVLAAEGCGDTFFLIWDYRKAVDYYDFGLKRMDALQLPYLSDRDKKTQENMVKKKEKAQRLHEIHEYGLGYRLYYEAEVARRESRYEDALGIYDDLLNKNRSNKANEKSSIVVSNKEALEKEPISPVFAEASEFYRNYCLVELGREKEAVKNLQAFINKNPIGLYRGEAYALAGEILLERQYSPGEALEFFSKAVDWFNTISEKDKITENIDVPQKTRRRIAPPLHMRREDIWGNSILSEPAAGEMFNRRTSSWYIPYQRMMAQTKRALVYFMLDKKEDAIRDIKVILEVDARERKDFERGLPNAYSRLLHEFQQGRLFATDKELSSFRGKAKTAIMVADYYYEIEQWEEAAKRYRRVDKEMRKELNVRAEAYLDFMLANTTFISEDNNEKALEYLSNFDRRYRNTPTWPRAMLAYFNIYQTMPGKEKEALASLQAIHKRLPETKWGKEAYYHMGEFLYAKGELDKAARIFKNCRKSFKDTWLARGANQYLEMIKEKEQ